MARRTMGLLIWVVIYEVLLLAFSSVNQMQSLFIVLFIVQIFDYSCWQDSLYVFEELSTWWWNWASFPDSHQKKSSLFKAMQAQMSPGSPLLKPFCPTCWTVRTKAIAAVLENYGLLLNDIGKRWVCTKINWPFKFYEEIQHILWFKAFLSYFLSYWTTFCHIAGQRHNYTGGCTSI